MRALTFGFLLVVGCGVPWAVTVQSGPPSAIAGATQITYASEFSQLIMDGQPAAELLAQQDPNEQANIQQALQEMDQEFINNFASRANVTVTPATAPPQEGEIRMTGLYTYVDRGARGPIGRSTVVTMRYSFSVSGQVVDEAEMSRSMKPSLTRSSIARRMRAVAGQLGSYGAKYFNQLQSSANP